LIRHALPQRTVVADGPADPALADGGLAQVAHLVGYLASERLDAVYSSPLRRAYQTAVPLADAHHRAVVVVDEVAEFDRHSSSYVPPEELKRTNDPRWQLLNSGQWDPADGDPIEFSRTVVTAIEQLIDRHAGERIAVVCHGGVIGAYIAHILDMPPRPQSFFYPNYTSINRVAAAKSGKRSVITLNETGHLRGTGLPMGLFQE
jgi:broad specificity phosphatase PhoE